MSARSLSPRFAPSRTLAAGLLLAACAALGCSSPTDPGDVNSPYEPEEQEGAGGADGVGQADLADVDLADRAIDGTPNRPLPTRCEPDLVACAGTCVDTGTDPQHCGACGNPCALAESCEAGACANP